jgi:lincosamide nucleotidyltransferase A/C/D/E
MRVGEVVQLVVALDRAGIRYWLGGGWGVDALHGEATREHRDLDLAVDVDTFEVARRTLEAMGFSAETDWLPVRLEMAGGPGGWVDLHPIRFTNDGDGVQEGLDGGTFAYPAADLVVGNLDGRDVPCISIRLQREFHAGYDPRPQDRHDLNILDHLEARSRA